MRFKNFIKRILGITWYEDYQARKRLDIAAWLFLDWAFHCGFEGNDFRKPSPNCEDCEYREKAACPLVEAANRMEKEVNFLSDLNRWY